MICPISLANPATYKDAAPMELRAREVRVVGESQCEQRLDGVRVLYVFRSGSQHRGPGAHR